MLEGTIDLIPHGTYRPQQIASIEIVNDGTHLNRRLYGNYKVTIDGVTVDVKDHERSRPVWDIVVKAWVKICLDGKDRKIDL